MTRFSKEKKKRFFIEWIKAEAQVLRVNTNDARALKTPNDDDDDVRLTERQT